MEDSELDICMAMYNGAEWLEDFLWSIKRQTHSKWRLIVSDDGSNDGSLDILKSFFCNDPNRLVIVVRESIGRGIVRNFHDALAAARADYIFLADQDDVWLPDKLSKLYKLIKELEGEDKSAALIFSDMLVVDEHLNTLSDSWWRYSGVTPKWVFSFKNMLCQNAVPGCSVVINRRLLDAALPIPASALMHDWWLLLVCSIVGKIAYCPDKIFLYRRHKKAATYSDMGGVIAALGRFFFQGKMVRSNFHDTVTQAISLKSVYEKRMSKPNLLVVQDYINASKENWIVKRWLFIKNGIRRTTLKGTFRFYFWI